MFRPVPLAVTSLKFTNLAFLRHQLAKKLAASQLTYADPLSFKHHHPLRAYVRAVVQRRRRVGYRRTFYRHLIAALRRYRQLQLRRRYRFIVKLLQLRRVAAASRAPRFTKSLKLRKTQSACVRPALRSSFFAPRALRLRRARYVPRGIWGWRNAIAWAARSRHFTALPAGYTLHSGARLCTSWLVAAHLARRKTAGRRVSRSASAFSVPLRLFNAGLKQNHPASLVITSRNTKLFYAVVVGARTLVTFNTAYFLSTWTRRDRRRVQAMRHRRAQARVSAVATRKPKLVIRRRARRLSHLSLNLKFHAAVLCRFLLFVARRTRGLAVVVKLRGRQHYRSTVRRLLLLLLRRLRYAARRLRRRNLRRRRRGLRLAAVV